VSDLFQILSVILIHRCSEYEEAVNELKSLLGLGGDVRIPSLRDRAIAPISTSAATAKRKEGEDSKMEDGSKSKRAKQNNGQGAAAQRDITSLIPFLTPEHLAAPKMPTRQEMDAILLELRKQALLQEYS
jgi:pre-mRNA-splicing factor ISY1